MTGATGGIGQAVAAVLRADVVACRADLGRLESLPDALADIEHVHALVHCAGVSDDAEIMDVSLRAAPRDAD